MKTVVRALLLASALVCGVSELHAEPLQRIQPMLLLERASAADGALTTTLRDSGDRPLVSDRRSQSLQCDDSGRWLLWITPDPEDTGACARIRSQIESLAARDVVLDGTLGDILEVWSPPSLLETLSEIHGVLNVGAPHRALSLVTSEGLEPMKVPEFQQLGHGGAGIKVGVIDIGFAGYFSAQGRELPRVVQTRAFDGQPSVETSGEWHGTACAEIIHDIAPEADLYLATVATASDLEDAVRWMIDEGVEVISHSLAWFIGGGDGTGPVHDLVDLAANNGVHWVTSSGNFAENHWMNPFRDSDGNGYVETGPIGTKEDVSMSRVGPNHPITLILLWDQWPLSEEVSFQIEVYDGSTFIESSEPNYDGYPYAFRQISVGRANRLADPRFRIRHTGGDASGLTLRVFRVDGFGNIVAEDRSESGSLSLPADSPRILSVGAYSVADGNLESFSSFGPTLTGVQKPELIAPDRVSVGVSNNLFVGTSASCPHVAGAVALLLSATVRGAIYDLHWSAEELSRMLATAAETATGTSPESTGWGRARMPLSSSPNAATPLLAVSGYGTGNLVFQLELGRSPIALEAVEPLRIFDVSGRSLGQIDPTLALGGQVTYRIEGTTLQLARGRYWAVEPRTGARTSFSWIE